MRKTNVNTKDMATQLLLEIIVGVLGVGVILLLIIVIILCWAFGFKAGPVFHGKKVMIINTAVGVDFSCTAIKQIQEKLDSFAFTLDEIRDIKEYRTSTSAPLLVLCCLDTRSDHDVDAALQRIHVPSDTISCKDVALIALHTKKGNVFTTAKDSLSPANYDRFDLVVDWHKDKAKETDNNDSAKKLDQLIRSRLR